MKQPSSVTAQNAQVAARNRVCMMSFSAYEAALQELTKLSEKFAEDLKIIKCVQNETTLKIKFCAFGNLMLAVNPYELFDSVWEILKLFGEFILKLNFLPAIRTAQKSKEYEKLKIFQLVFNRFTSIFLDYLNQKSPNQEDIKKFKEKFLIDIFVRRSNTANNKPKILWDILADILQDESSFKNMLEKIRDSFKFVFLSAWTDTNYTIALHCFTNKLPHSKMLDELAILACEPFKELSTLESLF